MRFRSLIPMRLQFFADGDGTGDGTGGGDGSGSAGGQGGQPNNGAQQGNPPAIDYERIQTMLNGALEAKEQTALKSFFKQQGLSQEEAEVAIKAFKEEKAKNTPDVGALQNENTQLKAQLRQEHLNSAVQNMATQLGADAKNMDIILKLAELGEVMGEDGKINEETLKAEINKVLDRVPGLKVTPGNAGGFVRIGGQPGNGGQGENKINSLRDALAQAMK